MNNSHSKQRYSGQQPRTPALRSAGEAHRPPSSRPAQPAAPAALAAMTDESLFDRYVQGDEGAFRVIVQRYEQPIRGFLTRRLADDERVQDLTQDTFFRVHRARDRYDSSRKFSTWIFTIANNLLKNEFRDRSRRREVNLTDLLGRGGEDRDSPTFDFEDERPDPEQLAQQGELRQAIEKAIGQMDDHHRVPFVMREVEDRTYEEIAEALAVPVGTVKSRLFRARTAFQALFPLPV